MNVGERVHENGEPHRAQGTFSVSEIKKEKTMTYENTQNDKKIKKGAQLVGFSVYSFHSYVSVKSKAVKGK